MPEPIEIEAAEEIPPFLVAECEAIIAEIHEVFRDVKLGGGTTWWESIQNDRDQPCPSPGGVFNTPVWESWRTWQPLVENDDWNPTGYGSGGFSFLDAEGFRFYLPAAMIKSLEQYDSDSLVFICGWMRTDRILTTAWGNGACWTFRNGVASAGSSVT